MSASSWLEDSSDSNSSYVLNPSSHYHHESSLNRKEGMDDIRLDPFGHSGRNKNPYLSDMNDSLWTSFTDDAFEGSGNGILSEDGSWAGENGVESTWDLEFRDSCRFWIQHVLVPIVVIIGVLGNAVTIYILTRRPMRSSTNV